MNKLFALITTLATCNLYAQTGIKGMVRDEHGDPLPFSTIYVKGTTNGTTANGDAQYLLRTAAGKLTIVAQHVGYQVVEREVQIESGRMLQLDFTLSEQALQLKTVTITAGDENPAYRVIREAIKKRKFYKNEVRAFKNDAYIKGLFRLDKRPERILGRKVTIDTGILYLSESVSEFSFEKPDKVKERMISSKVSGEAQGFSFNQASDFNINLYDKNFDLGISERSFVSPISNQAFIFYDYEWLGAFEEKGQLINKIGLRPKRATDPAFNGIMYIVEDTWRIHTVDLLVTKERGIEFADSLRISQVLAPIENNIWMPLSQQFSFQWGAFGFKGSGYFIGVYSNYEVEPNYELYKQEEIFTTTFEGSAEKDLFQDEDFTSEVLYIEKESNERDTTYWQKIRPVPLTSIEIRDYEVKDSIRLVRESMPYKDSVDQERNKLTLGQTFISGYTHYNSVDENYWTLPPLTGTLQFNTVEGFVTELQPTIYNQDDERTTYWIRPSLRYGFSSEDFYGKLDGSYRLLDDKFTRVYAGGGKYVAQFNEDEPISPLINSYLTMFGDNYMKLYEKSFAYARFEQELVNGIKMDVKVEYAARDTLTNTKTDYYWARTRDLNFTPNQPFSEELSNGMEGFIGTGFATNNTLALDLTFRIRFKQRYATRPDQKFIYTSKYPELYVNYQRGFVDTNYDFVSLRVEDDLSFGIAGKSSYSVEVGGFLNNSAMTFVDYKHFAGNQTVFSRTNGVNQFQLLPFYQFSTNDTYLEAHFEHHFNEFIFNKIPLVKRLNLQAVATANYLATDAIGNYVELGAGIEHIFKFLRIDYFRAFRDGDFFSSGFRIGIGF